MIKERDELHELIDQIPEKDLFKFKQYLIKIIFDSQVETVDPTQKEKNILDEALKDEETYSFDEVFKEIE
jgi:hypothetical protein